MISKNDTNTFPRNIIPRQMTIPTQMQAAVRTIVGGAV